MKKEQENKLLHGIYERAMETLLKSAENRQGALHSYATYLETVEQTTQVFYPDFNLEKDLELIARGLNIDIVRYVTTVDLKSQIEQFNFYIAMKSSL